MAAEAAAVANRQLRDATRVDRELEGLVVVDVADHAVDDAAGETAVVRRETDDTAVAVDVGASGVVDDEHAAGRGRHDCLERAHHRRAGRGAEWHQLHRGGRADDLLAGRPESHDALNGALQTEPVERIGHVRRRKLPIGLDGWITSGLISHCRPPRTSCAG